MKKLVAVVGIVAAAVAFATVSPLSTPAAGGSPAATAAPAAAMQGSAMQRRFAREPARLGDRDRSPSSIDHVTELQYRLRWAGVYRGNINANFGKQTKAAVKKYQRRHGLKRSGVASRSTWRQLIPDTVRRRGAVPRVCKARGWHACYDRTTHQVTLWHHGTLHNSWLVRGGGLSTPTRLGTNTVFYRDIDHRSGLFGSPMPYSQFFDGGQAMHGSVLMMNPFVDHSHGCVNFYLEDARQLWRLTHDTRLRVTVYGRWD